MTARQFAERLQEIKQGVKDGTGDAELADRLQRVGTAFKASVTPERFKEMLAANEPVDSALEEEMTTLWLHWSRLRGR